MPAGRTRAQLSLPRFSRSLSLVSPDVCSARCPSPQVINESSGHNVPKGSETHFKVVVVSDSFDGQMLIARHRMVNEILADELSGYVLSP